VTRTRTSGLLASLLVVLAAGEPARGQVRDPDVEAALRLALEGRCAAALPELERARGLAPRDAEVPLRLGECAIRLGRYGDAVEALEAARALAPERGDVALRLAIARYHAGDLAAAESALADAEAAGAEGPELDLYRGLLLLERGDAPRDAALAFERARSAGGDAVEPMASYYAGLAWAGAADRARAREALEGVVAAWPDTDWAREAKIALGRLDARRRYWASLRAGYEYDDNVVLLGNGVELPSEISSQRDERAAWLLVAGGELFRSGPWSAGAALSYEGWAQADLSEFDLHYPSLQLWLDRRLGERTTARVIFDGDYAWVDGEPFYTSHGAGVSLFENFGRAGTTELGARLWAQNYMFENTDVPDGPGTPGAPCLDDDDPICGPAGLDESRARNRDGTGFTLGVLHGLSLAGERARLRLGFRYYHFGARGTEYSFNAYETLGDLTIRLPARFTLRLAASWVYQPFRHPSTFPDPDGLVAGREYALSGSRRHDKFLDTELALARPITRHLTLSVSWRYQRSQSNVEVFDYRRQVLGAYVTASL
jgi:tetratricopeptide (TPR) repeat protein